MPGTTTKIIFGNGLDVTDQGGGVIRVDGGGGGGGAWTLLSNTTLAADGTFDVASISQAYNDLLLVLISRSTVSGTSGGANLWFNGNTVGYYKEAIQPTGTGAVSGAEVLGGGNIGTGTTGATSPAGSFGVLELVVYGYSSTAWFKAFQYACYGTRATSTGNLIFHRGGGSWNNTAAITRVQADGAGVNLTVGSQLRIYGRL